MPKRRIKRKRGEGIAISGPATVHVSRRVTLVIEAPREARVSRLAGKGALAADPAPVRPGGLVPRGARGIRDAGTESC
jgi:hypothetical protein